MRCGQLRRRAACGHTDRAVTLDHVVAELAEDLVFARATGDVVVAVPISRRRAQHVGGHEIVVADVVEQRDVVLRVQARIVLRHQRRQAVDVVQLVERQACGCGRVRRARHVIHLRAREQAEAHVDVVGAEANVGVVAGNRIGTGTAVDAVVAVERAGHVAAADQDVVAVAAVQRVAALLAHDEVASRHAIDRVVA